MPLDSKYKSIIELGILLGLAIFMAIALSFGITIFLGGSSHPTVAVTTGSMLPIYNGFQDNDRYPNNEIYPFRGDILLVKKVPIKTIEVGDVIVFNTTNDKSNPPVVHRVIAIWESNGEYFFETNGDNNEQPDNDFETTGNDVLGVVVFRIPHIGWFLLVVQTTFGKVLILALAVLILFIGDDSEEDTQSNDEGREIQHQQDNKNLVSHIIAIGKRILRNKSYTYAVLALFVIFLFLCVNLLSLFQYPSSVELYRIDDEQRVANLMVSPSPLTRSYKLEITNQTTFFFPIQIKIQSGGIFNNIDWIEIRVNETKGIYRWNTVYNFVGIRVFEGGIIAVMNRSSTIIASVSVSLYSRGIFASPPQLANFSISLRSSG
ncbi:MAG: signal peptidase I [Candidatus Thorarchaeota archaeon]